MNAFLTGSREYGEPNSKSDIDLVVLMDEPTAIKIRKLAGAIKGNPIRFGSLNLIICTDDLTFSVWKVGTSAILTGCDLPASRDTATAKIDEVREIVGIPKSNGDSGGGDSDGDK